MPRFKKHFLIILGLSIFLVCRCQKSDYLWLAGYDSQVGYDSSWGFYFGTSVVDFNYTPANVFYDSLKLNFDNTDISFSDEMGELIFYSNGITVHNGLGETITNGDSLGVGYVQLEFFPDIMLHGNRIPQGMLALPYPARNNSYILVYSFYDTLPSFSIYCRRTLAAELDMSGMQGHGVVQGKDLILLEDVLAGDLTAVKHANGRDWWLLVNKRNTNCFYKILVDASGPHSLSGTQCLGSNIQYNTIGASCFSPDGSKYIYQSLSDGVNIYDFDRCNGILSNSTFLPIPNTADSGWLGTGVSVSPNGRFLYVCLTKYVYQYDLWASDIPGSLEIVAIYDGYKSPLGSYFNTSQVGPDGKIYISCGNSETVLHVINKPDEKGAACDFHQHSVQLPSPVISVPNFPNYRLGPILGSSCDTLGLEVLTLNIKNFISVHPNPSSSIITVDYGFLHWDKFLEAEIQVYNSFGQIVFRKDLPRYSGFQKLDISMLPIGIYILSVFDKNQGLIGSTRFVRN